MGAYLVASLTPLPRGTGLSRVSLQGTRVRSSISGLAVSGLRLACSWQPLPGPGHPHPGSGVGGWGGCCVHAHLVSGGPCGPWPPGLPVGSRLPLEG